MRSISLRKSLRAKTASSASTVVRSRNSDDSRYTKAPKPTGAVNNDSASKTSTTQHKPAKRSRNRVPPPQRERIMQAYAAGKSIINISKQEKRNRETVGKIVHGPEIQEHVKALRERWFGLGSDAIGAIDNALTEQKDGRLGFQVLSSLGVIPLPEERRLLTAVPAAELTDEDLRVWKIVVDLMQIGAEANCVYGMPNPELEADLKRVGGKIDQKLMRIVPI